MITLSIDVTKLDKSRFIRGEKGTYCNLILIETPNSEYGGYMVKQDMSKEDREAGTQLPILGNAKVRGKQSNRHAPPPSRREEPEDDEIPF